ncbi:MAG: hypothetical protein V5A61_05130 [Haloarculaceae archaeon]|jgi:hypothetical protein
MTTTTPTPKPAALHSGASGTRFDTYAGEVIGVDWSGPGAEAVAVDGHLRTRPAA